jgi:MFS family permease
MSLPTSPPSATYTFKDLTLQRAFMRMWFARILGTSGAQMLMVAVGWQMYDLTGSAWDLGLVGLYQFVPALLLTLVAGHVADRVHRGRIIAACFAGQALVAMMLVAATQGLGSSGSSDARATGAVAHAGVARHAAPRHGV